jgi:hypothetical protein
MPLNYDFSIARGPAGERQALFRDPRTVAALRAAPAAVRDFLAESGFGSEVLEGGAPPGSYWWSEEGARLDIMERMSEALERYTLPKPGELPEGAFNLSHLFGAIMAAQAVPDPVSPATPRPAGERAAPPSPARPGGTGAGPGAPGPAPAPRPARPAPGADDPGLAGLRAGLTAREVPSAAASTAEDTSAGARRPEAGPALREALAGPGPEAAPEPAGPGAPEPAPPEYEAAGGAGELARSGRPGLGRLRAVLMLLVGIILLGYAVMSLL